MDQSHIDYRMHAGEHLAVHHEQRIVPPITWVTLANEVFMQNLITGPWVHVRR